MKKYRDKNWLYQKYVGEELSLREIAKLCKITWQTILYFMKKFNIPRRANSESQKLWHKTRPEILSGNKNPNWKGGITNDRGYVLISMPKHPRADKHGYVRRSHLVMKEKIGRYPKDNELIHHKNEIKDDDRPENLKIWIRGKHQSYHLNNRGRNEITRPSLQKA